MAQTAILSDECKAQNWQGAFLWFVSLSYFFQGFYYLGTRIYVLAMMANWGVLTDSQATVFAILGIPAYLKMFPGLLSDRVPFGRWGRRKPYIFLGGLVFIPGYLLLIKIQEFGWTWVAAILLILFAWLLSDSNLDALTVDITPQERTGKIQGAVQSSRQAGGILGTLLVPLMGPRLGWTPVLVILGIGALASSGAGLFLREFPVSRAAIEKELPLKWVLQETFNHKLVWLGLFFILFISATTATGNLLSIYLLSELGWSASPERMQTFAQVEILNTIATALGAFLIGRLPSKMITSFKLYAGFVLAFWILTLPWLLVDRSPGNLVLVYWANISVGFGVGIGLVLKAALAMRVCPKSIEGFTFALLSSTIYFGNLVVGAKTASAFVERLGGVVPALFTLIPYGLISLVFLYPLLQTINRQVGEPEAAVA
jgi:MFS family permease